MNVIVHTFIRIRNLFLDPGKEWETIAAENNSRKTIFIRFVSPLLCLIAVATIVGTWLSTSREVYSVSYVFCEIAILWTSLSAGLFSSAFVVTEIIARQDNQKNHGRTFALMAYSAGASLLVIAIVALFPFFNELRILMFYSCYLYWRGIPSLVQIQGQKRMIYGLLSFIILAIIHLLMFFLFGNILKAIFM